MTINYRISFVYFAKKSTNFVVKLNTRIIDNEIVNLFTKLPYNVKNKFKKKKKTNNHVLIS